jgi:protein gp37
MAENSKIEWCDHTFNPWIGCTKVGPGCDGCYAARQDAFRRWTPEGWGGPRRRTSDTTWKDPGKWNAQAEREGRRFRVFCASLADVFDNQVPAGWRRDLFNLILSTPHLDWLLLTKRIGNAARMIAETLPDNIKALPADHPLAWPWPHVWIGATVVNQEEADRDIQKLLAVPARVRFLSIEPMLGPIDLTRIDIDGDLEIYPLKGTTDCVDGEGDPCADVPALDWVIAGGESGPHARPMHPDWARSLRDQCAEAGVPFLFKQWGEWIPMMGHAEGVPVRGEKHRHPDGTYMGWAGKKAAGRLLDGVEHNGFPHPTDTR